MDMRSLGDDYIKSGEPTSLFQVPLTVITDRFKRVPVAQGRDEPDTYYRFLITVEDLPRRSVFFLWGGVPGAKA